MTPNIETLAGKIREIYAEDATQASESIEVYLQNELQGIDGLQRHELMEELTSKFIGSGPTPREAVLEDEEFLRFCALLLGHSVKKGEFAGTDLQERLTAALTTVFETLNQLIRTINLTLLENGQSQETIRFLIGEQLDGSGDDASLQKHLDKIKTAFVTSHRAFKVAMQELVEKILAELNPETLNKANDGGFRIGPLRKADGYDRYIKTYNECRQWYESGRCMEDFLRAFEKQCTTMEKQPWR